MVLLLTLTNACETMCCSELSAKGQRRFDVPLQRADEDWRVISPPHGD